jgi:hypothetical protein
LNKKGAEPNIPGILVLRRESRVEDGRLAVWRLREMESVSDNNNKPVDIGRKIRILWRKVIYGWGTEE